MHFCTFPADELSDQKRSRSPDFKGHQQLLAWHVSVFSWLHRDSGAAALHFCAYGTDENLAVFSDGIESGRPWRDPFVTGMCIYGMVHAVHIYTTRYEVPSKKDAHLKIALVADLHLGYSIGSHQMEEMVEKINAEEPDVVVIAGDIFDNEYDAIYEPDRVADLLAGLKSRYGTYACYGNHDLDEKILAGFTFETKEERIADRRFGEFLDRAKIHLLEDDVVCIDDAFIWRAEKIPTGSAKRRRHATRRPNCLPDWTSRFQFL